MSWRKALWEKVTISEDDVTVLDEETGSGFGAFEDLAALQENRRVEPRYTSEEVPAITGIQLSGEPVRLVNISSSGALVESSTRIKPGERVRLGIAGLTPNVVPGIVIRCVVSAINNGGKLRYESGIAFAHRVTLPLGPAALRTTPDEAPAAPAAVALTATAITIAIEPAVAPTAPQLPSAPPPAPAPTTGAADIRRALPRVRNRW